MDNQASQTADLYYLAAWAHNNRKRLISISVTVAVVAVVVGGYFWYQANRETSASEALSNIKQPETPQEAATFHADPQPYLKLAEEYSGTGAAARALLTAGSIQFDIGKFDDAHGTFEKFIGQYASSSLANQARIGIAASLEAQGKTKEATAFYEDMVLRHQADSTTPEAKSALGRLYLAQGKPELALKQYEELIKANNNDTWTLEAKIQRDELLAKYPNLIKQESVMPTASAAPAKPTTTNQAVTLPPTAPVAPAKTN